MTDLLERIKSHLSMLPSDVGTRKSPRLLLEASREIERLRLALVKIEQTIGPLTSLAPIRKGYQEEINEALRIVKETNQ